MSPTPLTPGVEFRKRTNSIMAAEAVGLPVSLGALYVVKHGLGQARVEAIEKVLAEHVILPLLKRGGTMQKTFENIRARFPGSKKDMEEETGKAEPHVASLMENVLEGDKPVVGTVQMTLEERAQKYAHTLFDFSVIAPVGISARWLMQTQLDKKQGLPDIKGTHYWLAKGPEFVASQVALVGLNTVGKGPAQWAHGKIAQGLEHIGASERNANSIATYATYVEPSAVTGNMANVLYLLEVSKRNARRESQGR